MVYRIGEGFAPTLADVQAALEPVQFVECGASQEKSIGWVPLGVRRTAHWSNRSADSGS